MGKAAFSCHSLARKRGTLVVVSSTPRSVRDFPASGRREQCNRSHLSNTRISRGNPLQSLHLSLVSRRNLEAFVAATLTLVIEIRPTQPGSPCRKLPFPPRFGLQTSKSTFVLENFASAVGESAFRNNRFVC